MAARRIGPLVLCAFAFAAESTLQLRVLDRETNAEIAGVRCAVVDPARTAVRGRFGNTYRGDIRPGDVLYVYRRGYDLARLPVPEGAGEITVRLRRSQGVGTLHVRGAAETDEFRVHVQPRVPGWPQSPITDPVTLRFRGPRHAIPLSAGMKAAAWVEAVRGGIVWPHSVWMWPGRTNDFHLDRPRRVPVRRDPVRRSRVEFLPDFLWRPPGPPDRTDTWRWHLNGPGWLQRGFAQGTLAVVPDVPFHLFAMRDDLPVYRYVTPADEVVDLRVPSRVRAVARRPLVNGRPVPENTLLGPGRLDPLALVTLWQLRDGMPGCAARAPPARAAWPDVRLPPAEWLTAWHPDLGLAHLRWPAGRTPTGRTYPGRVEIRMPKGEAASGHIAVYPVWEGTGRVRTAPPDRFLRKKVAGLRTVLFPGLPPGRHYGINMEVRLTDPRTGAQRKVRGMSEIELPANEPVLSIPLERR